MKRFKGKYAAFVALALALVSWGFLIPAIVMYATVPFDPSVHDLPPGLTYMVGSIIFSVLSLIPYTVEGIRSIIRAARWLNKKTLFLNIVLAILTLGLIPMSFFAFYSCYEVWFTYYGVVFVAELISIIPYCKKEPSKYLE
jgi:hypothetical protein